jgi:HEAT repeat protein
LTDAEWDRLLIDLRDSDRSFAAGEKLERIRDRSRVPALYALVGDSDFFVREAAAFPLARLEGLRALPALFSAMTQGELDGHDNDGLTAIVCDLLEEHAGEAAPLLLKMLESPEPVERDHGAWGLGFVARGLSAEPLLRVLREDADPRVRASAAGSLTGFAPVADVYQPLVDALGDANEHVRITAISSLGYLGDARAVDVLLQASEPASPAERRFIDEALRRLSKRAAGDQPAK